jgi:hypothetical protein
VIVREEAGTRRISPDAIATPVKSPPPKKLPLELASKKPM